MEEEKGFLETENGVFRMVSWLFDEIKVTHHKCKFNERSTVVTSKPDDVVRLHFGLKGDYCFTHRQLNLHFDLVGGHHNLMFSEGFDIEVENKTMEIETFGVQFSKRFFLAFAQDANEDLKRFCDAVEDGRGGLLSQQWGTVSPEIHHVIRQIIQCNYQGKMQQIFMLSKCLELLVISADGFSKATQARTSCLKTRRDREKVIAARDMINERLQSPPTLSEVARNIGLNEFKLKRGFKEMFNTSVFGYLAEQRMLLAYQYLLDSEKTAAEISYMTGYASPQHFNNAFKKRFGNTPYAVRKGS